MPKKVNQFPSLAKTLKSIIFGGKRVSFNYYDRDLNIAVMFNFVKEKRELPLSIAEYLRLGLNSSLIIYCKMA